MKIKPCIVDWSTATPRERWTAFYTIYRMAHNSHYARGTAYQCFLIMLPASRELNRMMDCVRSSECSWMELSIGNPLRRYMFDRWRDPDVEARKSLPELKEPESPEAALDDLQEEWDQMEDIYVKKIVAANGRAEKAIADNAALLEALGKIHSDINEAGDENVSQYAITWASHVISYHTPSSDHPGSALLKELEAARMVIKWAEKDPFGGEFDDALEEYKQSK